MVTKVSTKGQVVLPSQVRRRLGLQPGDPLEVHVDGEKIVLTPHPKHRRKGKIVIDPITGLPALSAAPDAPVLTSQQVAELMKDFP